jgi:hypothetical protein
MPFDPKRDLPPTVYDVYAHGPIAWMWLVRTAVEEEIYDVDRLASVVFYLHHKERGGRQIDPSETTAIAEWKNWRTLIKPMVPYMEKVAKKKAAQTEARDRPVNLFVLQANEFPKSREQTWDDGQHWTEIGTVVDLVHHIKHRCGSRGYVKTLRIGGHGGTTGSFRLGNTLVSLVNLDAIAASIKEVVPYFKPGRSLIYLDHCSVGHNQGFLKKVSAAFGGVAVIAPLESQYYNEGAPEFEGPATICGPGGCIRVPMPSIMEPYGLLELLYRFADRNPQEPGKIWDDLPKN